ncbi:ArsR family transcriptional regulator [Halopelagius fulvigenes]|uniref:ArsR family transcriptional regulator n=1 Tax=Halopelagius fulvigenes TaxID=1198324 RepID=A0ABD5TXB5_9EURY
MPYDERDETTKRFTRKFSDEDFLDAVRDGDDAGLTTRDVADAVGCKYRTAHARLSDLAEEGRVGQRKVGSVLLWLPTEEQ